MLGKEGNRPRAVEWRWEITLQGAGERWQVTGALCSPDTQWQRHLHNAEVGHYMEEVADTK